MQSVKSFGCNEWHNFAFNFLEENKDMWALGNRATSDKVIID